MAERDATLLDYARPTVAQRVSRIAAASLALAIAANPFVMRYLLYETGFKELFRRLSEPTRLVVLFLPALVGGFTGCLALRLINRRPERFRGGWMATTAIVVGVCWALLFAWAWVMMMAWRDFQRD